MPRHRLVAVPLRRLDRRLGGPGRPGLLPRRVQRLLRRLPRPHRLPRLHRRQHLRGQERLFRRRPLAQGRPARDAELPGARQHAPSRTSTATSWCSARRAARASNGTSGRPCTRPSAPTAIPNGSGTSAPASSTTRSPSTGASTTTSGHILERDWPKIGKKLEGKIHIYVGDMDNYYLNNAVYLMEDFLKKTEGPGLRRRGRLRRPRGALLERRPDPAQRHQPAPLSPDVRPEDRRADPQDGAAGRRRQELAVLSRSSAMRSSETLRRRGPGVMRHSIAHSSRDARADLVSADLARGICAAHRPNRPPVARCRSARPWWTSRRITRSG